jgi:hypothetical protein
MKRVWVRLSAGVLVSAALAFLATACGGGSSPSSPTTPTVKPKATVIINSTSVKGERTSTGYQYTVVVHLRETGGVGATITSIDLSFSSGSTSIGTTHFDNPLLTTHANKIAASGTADSKELVSTDDRAGSPYATKVDITCSFVDDNQNAGSCSATENVPPLPAQTYTLSGTVREDPAGTVISDAKVEVADGANAGKNGTTDASGKYRIQGLTVGSFAIRSTKSGFDTAERAVTMTGDTTVDLTMRRTPLPTYTLSGTVREQGTNAAIDQATVEIISGTNVGKSTLTNSSGLYTLSGLLAGVFDLRASKSGYDSGSRSITLSGNMSADMTLTKSAPPPPPPPPSPTCNGQSVPGSVSCGVPTAKCNDGTYSCSQNRSGTCSSHGGVACWICPGTLCNGIRAK